MGRKTKTKRHALPLIATVLAGLVATTITATGLRQRALRAQTEGFTMDDCREICNGAPPDEQEICMQACTEAFGQSGQSSQGASYNGGTGSSAAASNAGTGQFSEPFSNGGIGGSPSNYIPSHPAAPASSARSSAATAVPVAASSRPASSRQSSPKPASSVPTSYIPASSTPASSPPSAPAPVPPSASRECLAVPMRHATTGFCILADRCFLPSLAPRGFGIDTTCQTSVDFTHLYRSPAFRGGAVATGNGAMDTDLIGIINRAIVMLDALSTRLPGGSAAVQPVRDLRSYFLTVLRNAGPKQLTTLEIEATAQYMRLRMLEMTDLLQSLRIDPSDGSVDTAAERIDVVKDLSALFSSVLPRFLERVATVKDLDMAMARSFTTTAAGAFEEAERTCTKNPLEDSCATTLSDVFAILQALEESVRTPLEKAGLFASLEEEFTLKGASHGAAPGSATLKPHLEQ